MKYPNSLKILDEELGAAPNTKVTYLARALVEGAKKFDLQKLETLGVNYKIKDVIRNVDNPPSCTTEEVAKASWADPLNFPLQEGEEWNQGRRATATGIEYEVFYGRQPNGLSKDFYDTWPDHKKEASVMNPYMKTGINGRGCLGQNGPNHAVDNGIVVIKPDAQGKITLHVLGIKRKFDDDAPAFSGGFAHFSKNEQGVYVFDEKAILNTKVEEFFEEMISGSIELLPEYRDRLPLELAMETQKRALSVRNPRFPHKLVSEDEIKVLQMGIEAELKFEQVKDKDPVFVERLYEVVSQSHECFAGPVLNDNRNTNQAWIETRLSWFEMNDDIWRYIKGKNPVFDYNISAGDDASGIVYHKIDSDLIQSAYASHGAMFAFTAASFLLDAQEKGREIYPDIIHQLEGVVSFFDQFPEPHPEQELII